MGKYAAICGAVCVLALNLRWFLPAEDAADGATLWLAAFWCVAAVLGRWYPFATDAIARRWTRSDAAVAMLVGGHVLSGALVLILGGNRHSAVILIAEWCGIAAVWSILRDLARIPAVRTAIWQSTLLSLTAIATLGCWQHWVELPSMAQRLGPKFDAARAGNETARQELSRAGVPLTDPEFTLFEKRLRDSREPFAFFALANTLGGFLAAGLMLLIGGGWAGPSAVEAAFHPEGEPPAEPRKLDFAGTIRGAAGASLSRKTVTVLWLVAIVVVAMCLLLTKSRTAWLALLLVGGVVVAVHFLRTRFRVLATRRNIGLAAGMMVALIAFGIGLSRAGSWDREILTEAAKSLSYRRLYWEGTARLISEQPLLGGGLGQFRNAYLRVKAPEASEEIADPHNFVLDVWFQGGILAAVGALWLVVTVLLSIGKAIQKGPTATDWATENSWFLLAGAAAPWGAFLVLFAGTGDWDDRLLIIVLGMMAVAALIYRGKLPWPTAAPLACGAAGLVLWTHLLGAGGIGYPAVLQFLLLCLVGTFSIVQDEPAIPSRRTVTDWITCGLAAVGALVVCSIWMAHARGGVEAADALLSRGASATMIRAAYTQALQADPWDPVPCARLAEFEFQQWEAAIAGSSSTSSEWPDTLKNAERALEAAQERDPANGQWPYRLGTMLRRGVEVHPSSERLQQVCHLFEQAVRRYPTNAAWQAALSDAAAAVGDVALAEQAARKALSQDEVNQRFGHVERILAADVRARLQQRLESTAAP